MSDKDRVLLKEVLGKLDKILATLEQLPIVISTGGTPPPEGEGTVPDTTAGLVRLMEKTNERC